MTSINNRNSDAVRKSNSQLKELRSSNNMDIRGSQALSSFSRKSIVKKQYGSNKLIASRTSTAQTNQEGGFFYSWYSKLCSGLFACCGGGNVDTTMRTSTNNFQTNGSFAYSFVAKDGVRDEKEPNFETGRKQK